LIGAKKERKEENIHADDFIKSYMDDIEANASFAAGESIEIVVEKKEEAAVKSRLSDIAKYL